MDTADWLDALMKRLNDVQGPFAGENTFAFLADGAAGLAETGLERVCPIHGASLGEEIRRLRADLPEDHVLSILVSEHECILDYLDEIEDLNVVVQAGAGHSAEPEVFERFDEIADFLVDADRHNRREEEVLFPALERRGLASPAVVLRGEHQSLRLLRAELKKLLEALTAENFEAVRSRVDAMVRALSYLQRRHIFRENNVLYPAAVRAIPDDALWRAMQEQCDRIGYCTFTPAPEGVW